MTISIIKRSGEPRNTEGDHAFVTEYYKNFPCILKDNNSHRLLNSFQQFELLTYTWINIFSFMLTTSGRVEGWTKRCLLKNLLFTRPVFHWKNKWNHGNFSPLLLYLLKFLVEKLEASTKKAIIVFSALRTVAVFSKWKLFVPDSWMSTIFLLG